MKINKAPCGVTNTVPIPKANVADNDLKENVKGGILSGIKNAWLCQGPFLKIIDITSGNKIAGWRFGVIGSMFGTEVTCVVQLPHNDNACNLKLIVVGLECEEIGGMICIFDVQGSRVLRAIRIPSKPLSLSIVDSGSSGCEGRYPLPGLLSSMSGIIAVGLRGGNVFLIDLCRVSCEELLNTWFNDDREEVHDEMNPCQLVLINKDDDDSDMLERKCSTAAVTGDHLCLLLNDGAILQDNFLLLEPGGDVCACFKSRNIGVTSLLYIPQIASLIVGYSFGCFQIWNLMHLTLNYTSRLMKDPLPILHFGFQEPSDDPCNFCYLWSVNSSSDEFPSSSSPVGMMYALSYDSKEWVDGYGYLYQDYQSCRFRFEYNLEADSAEDIDSVCCVSCSTLSNVIVQKNLPEDGCDEATSENDFSLCIFAWEAYDSENKPISTFLSVFDLNQWYKDQMPARITDTDDENISYLVTFSLGCIRQNGEEAILNYNPLLDIRIDPQNLSQFRSFQLQEEHYHPSALSFVSHCLLEDRTVSLSHPGLQRYLLLYMEKEGPICLLRPLNLFKHCVMVGLKPVLLDISGTTDMPAVTQREFLLSVALENQMLGFLHRCASDWANGSVSGVDCSLPMLLSWGFQRAGVLKETADNLCVHLFDHTGIRLDKNECKLLVNCATQLRQLATLFEGILGDCRLLSLLNLDDIKEKTSQLGLIALYFEVLQWFLYVGLLPEFPENEVDLDSSNLCDSSVDKIPYPSTILTKFYNNRRNEFKTLNLKNETKACLYIDRLLQYEKSGLELSSLWQSDGGSGMYPPPSIQSLLNMYLIDGIDIQTKNSIVIYVFLDLATLLDPERYSRTIEYFVKFPCAFCMTPSIIKVTQAFWLLDQKHFEDALDMVLDPLVSPKDLQPWQHRFIIQALLSQGQPSKALEYFTVRQLPIQSVDDIQLKITLLIMNKQVTQAYGFFQQYRNEENSKELLNHFFQECGKCQQLGTVLKLMLSPMEEELFMHYLQNSNISQTDDMQVVFYLMRSRVIEAVAVNERLNSNSRKLNFRHHRNHPAVRDVLVGGYSKTLPSVTRQLANYCSQQKKLLSNWRQVQRPTPMSVDVNYGRKQTVSYKSSLIQATLEKARETWMMPINSSFNSNERNKDTIDVSAMQNLPFLCTSHDTSRNDRETTPVVFPSSTSSAKRRLDDEGGTLLSTPSKRSRLESSHSVESFLLWSNKKEDQDHSANNSLLQKSLVKRVTPLKNTNNSSTPQINGSRVFAETFTPQSILKVRNLVRSSVSPDKLFGGQEGHISSERNRSARSCSRQIRFSIPVPNDVEDQPVSTSTPAASVKTKTSHAINATPRLPIRSSLSLLQKPVKENDKDTSRSFLEKKNLLLNSSSKENIIKDVADVLLDGSNYVSESALSEREKKRLNESPEDESFFSASSDSGTSKDKSFDVSPNEDSISYSHDKYIHNIKEIKPRKQLSRLNSLSPSSRVSLAQRDTLNDISCKDQQSSVEPLNVSTREEISSKRSVSPMDMHQSLYTSSDDELSCVNGKLPLKTSILGDTCIENNSDTSSYSKEEEISFEKVTQTSTTETCEYSGSKSIVNFKEVKTRKSLTRIQECELSDPNASFAQCELSDDGLHLNYSANTELKESPYNEISVTEDVNLASLQKSILGESIIVKSASIIDYENTSTKLLSGSLLDKRNSITSVNEVHVESDSNSEVLQNEEKSYTGIPEIKARRPLSRFSKSGEVDENSGNSSSAVEVSGMWESSFIKKDILNSTSDYHQEDGEKMQNDCRYSGFISDKSKENDGDVCLEDDSKSTEFEKNIGSSSSVVEKSELWESSYIKKDILNSTCEYKWDDRERVQNDYMYSAFISDKSQENDDKACEEHPKRNSENFGIEESSVNSGYVKHHSVWKNTSVQGGETENVPDSSEIFEEIRVQRIHNIDCSEQDKNKVDFVLEEEKTYATLTSVTSMGEIKATDLSAKEDQTFCSPIQTNINLQKPSHLVDTEASIEPISSPTAGDVYTIELESDESEEKGMSEYVNQVQDKSTCLIEDIENEHMKNVRNHKECDIIVIDSDSECKNVSSNSSERNFESEVNILNDAFTEKHLVEEVKWENSGCEKEEVEISCNETPLVLKISDSENDSENSRSSTCSEEIDVEVCTEDEISHDRTVQLPSINLLLKNKACSAQNNSFSEETNENFSSSSQTYIRETLQLPPIVEENEENEKCYVQVPVETSTSTTGEKLPSSENLSHDFSIPRHSRESNNRNEHERDNDSELLLTSESRSDLYESCQGVDEAIKETNSIIKPEMLVQGTTKGDLEMLCSHEEDGTLASRDIMENKTNIIEQCCTPRSRQRGRSRSIQSEPPQMCDVLSAEIETVIGTPQKPSARRQRIRRSSSLQMELEKESQEVVIEEAAASSGGTSIPMATKTHDSDKIEHSTPTSKLRRRNSLQLKSPNPPDKSTTPEPGMDISSVKSRLRSSHSSLHDSLRTSNVHLTESPTPNKNAQTPQRNLRRRRGSLQFESILTADENASGNDELSSTRMSSSRSQRRGRPRSVQSEPPNMSDVSIVEEDIHDYLSKPQTRRKSLQKELIKIDESVPSRSKDNAEKVTQNIPSGIEQSSIHETSFKIVNKVEEVQDKVTKTQASSLNKCEPQPSTSNSKYNKNDRSLTRSRRARSVDIELIETKDRKDLETIDSCSVHSEPPKFTKDVTQEKAKGRKRMVKKEIKSPEMSNYQQTIISEESDTDNSFVKGRSKTLTSKIDLSSVNVTIKKEISDMFFQSMRKENDAGEGSSGTHQYQMNLRSQRAHSVERDLQSLDDQQTINCDISDLDVYSTQSEPPQLGDVLQSKHEWLAKDKRGLSKKKRRKSVYVLKLRPSNLPSVKEEPENEYSSCEVERLRNPSENELYTPRMNLRSRKRLESETSQTSISEMHRLQGNEDKSEDSASSVASKSTLKFDGKNKRKRSTSPSSPEEQEIKFMRQEDTESASKDTKEDMRSNDAIEEYATARRLTRYQKTLMERSLEVTKGSRRVFRRHHNIEGDEEDSDGESVASGYSSSSSRLRSSAHLRKKKMMLERSPSQLSQASVEDSSPVQTNQYLTPTSSPVKRGGHSPASVRSGRSTSNASSISSSQWASPSSTYSQSPSRPRRKSFQKAQEALHSPLVKKGSSKSSDVSTIDVKEGKIDERLSTKKQLKKGETPEKRISDAGSDCSHSSSTSRNTRSSSVRNLEFSPPKNLAEKESHDDDVQTRLHRKEKNETSDSLSSPEESPSKESPSKKGTSTSERKSSVPGRLSQNIRNRESLKRYSVTKPRQYLKLNRRRKTK